MSNAAPNRDETSRDELCSRYLDQLPYEPYPVQEEALLSWFEAEQGVLVCAPTGTGKTLIAEAALFEALHLGRRAYYTTPLIALTEQKFQEMKEAAVGWGFSEDDVGLVTGNRRENPGAKILVVVAEILLNRLLHREAFDFDDVWAVVMDEFHSFNDPERGMVWELTLGLLPAHVRTLLLSATVGNASSFVGWLRTSHDRKVTLVHSEERKVPLQFHWVGDALLSDHVESMFGTGELDRKTPALIFCFNRDQCWNVAERLRGKKIITDAQQKGLAEELEKHELSTGAGPKLKQLLMRGVGVHHAGVLPKYRRLVEELFQRRMLSFCTCTETLSAGINLPARSVVVPNLLKGPPGDKKIIASSSAHQIFGRAGRPQYDDQGHVFVLAHEDDVKIARWREKYDQIPEDTKDPGLRKAKKQLKKKMPTRRSNEQYWNEDQFRKLVESPPGKLASRGGLPWRLLAYMIEASPDVELIRKLVGKRLMSSKKLEDAQQQLDEMLLTLHRGGFVQLEPEPPRPKQTFGEQEPEEAIPAPASDTAAASADEENPSAGRSRKESSFGAGILDELTSPDEKPEPAEHQAKDDAAKQNAARRAVPDVASSPKVESTDQPPPPYRALRARPTEKLAQISVFRSVNPIYGSYLIEQLGIADRAERIQALESVLEMPGTVARLVRVPRQSQLPPGPLANTRLDERLLKLGLATPEEISEQANQEARQERRDSFFSEQEEERVFVLSLAEKLERLFRFDFPGAGPLRITGVWAAGELVEFGGKFDNFVTSRGLQKQEGVVFRHVLRMILLINEFLQLTPPETTPDQWQTDLAEVQEVLTRACREVDPTSTDKALEEAQQEVEI